MQKEKNKNVDVEGGDERTFFFTNYSEYERGKGKGGKRKTTRGKERGEDIEGIGWFKCIFGGG